MSFLIQRASGRNLTLVQINTPVLRIGRGTNQELRSENPAVALEHAILEGDAAGYLITDKGSITGTYVNRKPVETARLVKGDVIEIGDLRIDVQLADPAKPLFLRITVERPNILVEEEGEEAPAAVAAAPGVKVVKSRKFDYAGAYKLHRPWLTKLTITALLLIVTLAVIGEVIRPERQKVFMPGGLSSAHSRARDPRTERAVADDCAACHLPWRSVSSSKCIDCHPQQPHTVTANNDPDCFACHAEHRGATKLGAIPDTSCVACHSTQRVAVSGFGAPKHPDFSYPKDANTLRFDHKLHLAPKGVFNAKGKRTVLQCATCHELTGAAEPKPVTFAKHCHDCHRLGFDTRFPDDEVPHGGDNGIVYGYIAARYSGDRDVIGKPPAEVRRILTARKRVNVDDRAVVLGVKVFEIRCRFCHEVKPRGDRLAVTPPVIPANWLSGAKFTHDRHRTIDCEKCHQGARASVPTSDVLMPAQSACTDCHAQNDRTAQARSTCLTCHEYHLRPQRPISKAGLAQAGFGELGGNGRMLQGILLAVIVVLLLVVLVPVGVALFRRLSPERTPPAREKAPPPPPLNLPTSKIRPMTADVPTDKVNRQPSAPPPPPPDLTPSAAPPVAPPPDRTRVPDASDNASSGTEMLQWYGMLHCTSGPLEGQRFIIEDEGFYIGRDPSLSKVVVPDTRVSKRHLRIVPRDGKVWALDQGSTNGTFMGGQKIAEVQLKRGDTLILGDNAATFVYQV
ncbi:MAG TPA: FHA domain-containing protein [Thermoanaerobaculia bacterium]|nr:FHA domain-containing protein [Thermoanaerobaculia bacterium]